MQVLLKVNPEYEKLLPVLPTSEYEALKKSIKAEGLHYPIIVNQEMVVLDGHNRYRICLSLGLEPRFEVKAFSSNLLERKFVLESNLLRRHLDTWNKVQAFKPLLEIYRKEAQERQTATQLIGKGIQQKEIMATQNFGEPTEALEQFAKVVHSNPETVRQALYVDEHAQPEIKEKLNEGKLTINAAFVQTKSDEKLEQIKQVKALPIPEGKHRCIVIDPPWPMHKIEREVRPNQTQEIDYPTMTLEEISNLPIIDLADRDGCHVYLWTTHKFLSDAFDLFLKWGVKYECLMTWVKNVGFTPFSWMYNTEHVLFGRIGTLKLEKLGMKLSFDAPVTKHSEKPDVFFERVREASPEPRLEMFARKPHEGFKPWGNEIDI